MAPHQVALINDGIRSLSLSWLVLATPADAIAFERAVLHEWMPPLSRR